MTSEDVKNLTVGAALAQFLGDASGDTRRKLLSLLGAAARDARYAALRQILKPNEVLLTAHHALR